MTEITGNIWKYWNTTNSRIVIPTNAFVKNNGHAVMGRGLALQAQHRFKNLTLSLGLKLDRCGDYVHEFPLIGLFCFQVKNHWAEPAKLELIEASMMELVTKIKNRDDIKTVYMPRVGCGNGRLTWADVKPIIEKYSTEKIVVVNL